ncbi:DUF6301 family protein [Dactylosporangium salmoneum]|uniref:Uncharacterized protein n=1 Tax=Dactylosporangium salmoneum TaxID=53361 RepID=A0ABN3G7A7_9ACTN
MSTAMRMLDATQVRGLAHRLLAAGPLLYQVPPDRIAAELGWSLLPRKIGSMRFADPGLPVGTGQATLGVSDNGAVRTVAVPVSDPLPDEETDDDWDFHQDAFAIAGRALTEDLGPVGRTIPGDQPVMEWRRGETALQLSRGRNTVNLHLFAARDVAQDDDV